MPDLPPLTFATAERVARAAVTEAGLRWVPWRVVAVEAVIRPLPEDMAANVRTALYRWAGVRIGRRTLIRGPLRIRGGSHSIGNLSIGRECVIYPPASIDCSAAVRVGDRVTFGPQVSIVTANHDTADPKCRAGALLPAPVTIGDGAWLGLGAIVLPGVTIGAGAVVAAGAIVTRDVEPHTIVAGSPARLLRRLDD